MDDFEKEIKISFLEEAEQNLTDVEQCFLSLEQSSNDDSVLEKIFRLAHNLKGSARAVGFVEMGEFTHVLESLLLKLKTKEFSITSSIVSLLLRCNDCLVQWVETLKQDLDCKMDNAELKNELSEILANPQSEGDTVAEAAEDVVVEEVVEGPSTTGTTDEELFDLAQVEAALGFGADAMVPDAAAFGGEEPATASAETSAPALTVVPAAAMAAPTPAPAKPATEGKLSTPAAPGAPSPAAVAPEESVRVSSKRLERLMNNVGELVILQTVLNQQKVNIPNPLIQKTISQLAKITKDIQDISMSLRMVPLRQTFQKMQRIVRDTSRSLDKDIELILLGEDTEIDKTLVEHLGDPLVHLIRNACDHGIETADERKTVGKSVKGMVKLSAFHRGGHIVIEIQDDGKGLYADKLKAKAIEKGILKDASRLSDKEAHNLIFHPGFSTKAVVTDISGRGVGLDVVKTNVEKVLKGEVQIDTVPGSGTCFRILLPLTLGIIDGMVVTAGDDRYIVPLSQIRESIQPKREGIEKFNGLGEVLLLRGQNFPVRRLSQLMGKKPDNRNSWDCIAIIVAHNEFPYALLVDDILGQQQIVIKQLGEELRNTPGFSGGAILGDGKAALILDVNELIHKAKVKPGAAVERGVA